MAPAPPPPEIPPDAVPPPPPPPEPGSELSVFVMTMGPGDHPFFSFGHNAIWIRDATARPTSVYNFGTFRFDSPRMILDFLGGRLNYWLSVSPLPHVVGDYRRENRSITIQELNLAAGDARSRCRSALDVNARPENRLYKYDYFLDNCSTRVRDAIDRRPPAVFCHRAQRPARLTLREHALRMTADRCRRTWRSTSCSVRQVDQPIDRWAEMFLPAGAARGLSAVTLPGAGGQGPRSAGQGAADRVPRRSPADARWTRPRAR